MFHAVHAESGSQHQDEDDEYGGQDLVPFFLHDGHDDVEGVVGGVDPEKMEDPDHTEHAEYHKAGQEEERKDGKQVDDPVRGTDELQRGFGGGKSRVEKFRRPEPQDIFDAENKDRDPFRKMKRGKGRAQLIKGQKDHRRDIDKDHHGDEHIKKAAREIAFIPDLDDIEYSALFHLTFHDAAVPVSGQQFFKFRNSFFELYARIGVGDQNTVADRIDDLGGGVDVRPGAYGFFS